MLPLDRSLVHYRIICMDFRCFFVRKSWLQINSSDKGQSLRKETIPARNVATMTAPTTSARANPYVLCCVKALASVLTTKTSATNNEVRHPIQWIVHSSISYSSQTGKVKGLRDGECLYPGNGFSRRNELKNTNKHL